MSRSKVVVFMVVMTFVLGLAIGHAVAGEKLKARGCFTLDKWEQIDVGDEEGHLIAVWEAKAIVTVFEGKAIPDGVVLRSVGTDDMNTETAVGSDRGYNEMTDSEGDKIYYSWEGKQVSQDSWEGEYHAIKGTGKYEGIKEKGTWSSRGVAPGQWYTDWEGEVEIPGR